MHYYDHIWTCNICGNEMGSHQDRCDKCSNAMDKKTESVLNNAIGIQLAKSTRISLESSSQRLFMWLVANRNVLVLAEMFLLAGLFLILFLYPSISIEGTHLDTVKSNYPSHITRLFSHPAFHPEYENRLIIVSLLSIFLSVISTFTSIIISIGFCHFKAKKHQINYLVKVVSKPQLHSILSIQNRSKDDLNLESKTLDHSNIAYRPGIFMITPLFFMWMNLILLIAIFIFSYSTGNMPIPKTAHLILVLASLVKIIVHDVTKLPTYSEVLFPEEPENFLFVFQQQYLKHLDVFFVFSSISYMLLYVSV